MPEQPNLLKQSTTYTFKYNSDSDSIDLNTLLLSQIHFSTILNEIKNEVARDSDLSIKIRPLEKGSVPFDFILNVSWLHNLFTPEIVAYASGIVSTLVGLFQLKIWLMGEKPTRIEISGDKVIIYKGETQIIVDRHVYNLYDKNATVDIALKKGFEAIEKEEEITGIEIQDSNKEPILIVPRQEFEGFTIPNKNFETLTQTEPARQETLTIIKVVFEKGFKWQFYQSNGRKINASIDDENFMARINSGEQFAKGDSMVVELQVEKVFDKTVNIFVEKDFKITKVISHTPRQEPPTKNNLF